MFDQQHNEQLALELAQRSPVQIILETSTLLVIALASFVGNFCVLGVFYKSPRLRNATSFYLISLSTSDIVLAMFVMPTSIVTSIYGRDVFYDKIGKLAGWIFAQSAFVSLYTTTFIAINRFFCVVKPLFYRKYFRRKTVIQTILGVWVFIFIFILVLYLSAAIKIEFYPGRLVYFIICTDETSSILTAVSHFILIILPLTLTGICYWKLFVLVKGHHTPDLTAQLDSRSNFKVTKEEIRITRCLLSLVSGFAICWIPCSILFHTAIYVGLPRSLEMVILYTAYISSAINPFLYNIVNKPFRRRFLTLIWPVRNSIEALNEEPG